MKYYRASILILFVLTTIAVGPCSQFGDQEYLLVTRVIDGDTIELEDGLTIRYTGADTPETVHPTKPVECYGPEASEFNKELVEGRHVWLDYDVDKEDRYGRTLAYVYVQNGKFVNAELVRQGYARASPYEPNTRHKAFFAELDAAIIASMSASTRL